MYFHHELIVHRTSVESDVKVGEHQVTRPMGEHQVSCPMWSWVGTKGRVRNEVGGDGGPTSVVSGEWAPRVVSEVKLGGHQCCVRWVSFNCRVLSEVWWAPSDVSGEWALSVVYVVKVGGH